MKVTDVDAFLNGRLPAKEFQAVIRSEVDAWGARLRERGRSASVTLIGEKRTLDLTPTRALRLLDALLTNDLTAPATAYVANALLLSPEVRWSIPAVRDCLEQLVMPAIANVDLGDAWKARDVLAAIKHPGH